MLADADPIVDVPHGRLAFGDGDLDVWAEHLAWCLSLFGVGTGVTVAVQDFGSSPLSFLGSALLLPGLRAGLAERLQGRFIGLDACPERVTLTAGVLAQADPDVLVVRNSVLPLLLQMLGQRGVGIERSGRHIVVAFDGGPPALPGTGAWHRLFHVESALVLAPQCPDCGCYHLRKEHYALEGECIVNRRLPVPAMEVPAGAQAIVDRCPRGPDDRLLRWAGGYG
ncbi:MAG: hypothetical protein IT495_08315 [Gammaproteobacteria bacterium]|nr:hypothetical protein [Gammaproteobacteria bacterium]